MNRREAMRWMGLASLAILINVKPGEDFIRIPEAVKSHETLYRGMPDGNIHVSQDGGQTWSLHSRLGPQMVIKRLSNELGGRVIAYIEYQGWPIQLSLAKNGKFWEAL